MSPPRAVSFNAVAGTLSQQGRLALLDMFWTGGEAGLDGTADEPMKVVPDRPASTGESLFYVGYPGSKRDRIETQHYLVAATDAQEAFRRAYELYSLLPRHRKGAKLRAYFMAPRSHRMPVGAVTRG